MKLQSSLSSNAAMGKVSCPSPPCHSLTVKTWSSEGSPGSRLGKESLVFVNTDPPPLITSQGCASSFEQSFLFEISFLSNIKLRKGVKAQVSGEWTSDIAMRSVIQCPWQVLGPEIVMFFLESITCPEISL